MLDTILSALLPMVFTFLLGLVAARRHDFGSKDASTLNRMVLLYAVPMALFAGTVTTSRAALSRDIPLVIALCIGIIGLYGMVFLLCRVAFHMQVSTSALAALTGSAPAVPFVGPAVLGDLFGGLSAIPIAIAGLDSASHIRFDRERPTGKLARPPRRRALGNFPKVVCLGFCCQTRGNYQRTYRLGTRSRFYYRADRIPHSPTPDPPAFPAGTGIRRCRSVCLRDRACNRKNQSQLVRIVLRIPEKHRAARPGPRWFAMGRLWQSHCQRSGADDGHSNHAYCHYACSAVRHGTDGGGFRCVPQRDGLDDHDGGFHRPDTLNHELST